MFYITMTFLSPCYLFEMTGHLLNSWLVSSLWFFVVVEILVILGYSTWWLHRILYATAHGQMDSQWLSYAGTQFWLATSSNKPTCCDRVTFTWSCELSYFSFQLLKIKFTNNLIGMFNIKKFQSSVEKGKIRFGGLEGDK